MGIQRTNKRKDQLLIIDYCTDCNRVRLFTQHSNPKYTEYDNVLEFQLPLPSLYICKLLKRGCKRVDTCEKY